MKSKEKEVMELFFENPTKEWHFEEVVREAKISRGKADAWLKKLVKDRLIKRHKRKGKMPHYISNYASSDYKNKKRLFAMNKLYESGLTNHLCSLKKAKTIILFGSFSRSDWYKDSDIDIFIYGDPDGLKIANYELKLQRNIQLFVCQNKKDFGRLGAGLLKNIIKGSMIKGSLDFIEVGVNA